MGLTKPSSTYKHPRKGQRPEVVPVTEAKEADPEKSKITGSAGGADKGKKVSRPNAETSASIKDAQIRLVLYPPSAGQLSLYDEMINSGVPANKALLGLLKKGFPKFEADLLAGKISAPTVELEKGGKPVDTTRNVSVEFFKRAKETFDPYDILSDRALGQRVAETIVRSVGKAGLNG